MLDALLLAALLSAPALPAALPAQAPAPPDAEVYDDAWLDAALAGGAEGAAAVPPPQGRAAPEGTAWLRRAAALSVDALPSARPLRQPLPSRPAVEGTLEAATAAEKGAAVLAMVEAYAGPDRWRATLAAARAARASSGADAAPLLAALSGTAGADVAAALAGFLGQAGAPVLRAEVRCEPKGARAVLRQEPLAPGGAAARSWTVPVCLRTGVARGEVTVCTLAAGPVAEVPLPSCPAWLWPNAGGAGYFVTATSAAEAARLWPHLTAGERLSLAVDAALLTRREALPLSEALALVAPLAREGDPRQAAAALLLARLVEPRWLGPVEHSRWRAFLRRTFGARARSLGWLPRADDGEGARALRPVLLPLLAGEGEEAVLAGEALALARRWLADRRQVPAEVAWPALQAAAHHGDQDLFDRVAAEAGRAEPPERALLHAVLGRFREAGPAGAALALAASPATGAGDAAQLLATALQGRDTRAAALRALRDGWEALAPRLSREAAGLLVEAVARTACEPAARAEAVAFLGPRAEALDLAPVLELALEDADACLSLRAHGGAAVARFLEAR